MNKVDDLLVEDVENDLLLIVGHILQNNPPPSKLSRHSAGGGGSAIVWQTSVCNSQNSPYLSAGCFCLSFPVIQQVQFIVFRGARSTKGANYPESAKSSPSFSAKCSFYTTRQVLENVLPFLFSRVLHFCCSMHNSCKFSCFICFLNLVSILHLDIFYVCGIKQHEKSSYVP